MIAALLSKINRSVTAKFLVTFLLLLIIPLLVTIPLFVNGLHRVLKSKEQDYITEKISYAKTQIDTTFSEMDHIATSLILDYHVTDILSDSSTVGDALSTTCFVLGPEEGMQLIESLDEVEAVFVTKDYALHYSSGLSPKEDANR